MTWIQEEIVTNVFEIVDGLNLLMPNHRNSDFKAFVNAT